ncbi:RyR domain-containing protein [Pelosinus sp. sgz500959]|uniref:RyR domain-containing protein n=1 Tax=Pelosinus sp. sgz500959 TaxID=3242472 RepID=UPI003671F7E1
MQCNNFKIVVSGDICINSLYWITDPQKNNGLNWQNNLNMHSILLPGEALLLTKLVTLATGSFVLSPEIQDLESVVLKEYIRAVAEVEPFPVFATKKNNDKVYRVKRFLGFAGPSVGQSKLLPIKNDDANADMVIIDDENNGYHSNEKFWPLALKTPQKEPIVLYKMSNPINSTILWKQLEKYHIDKTIVVINSDDLRSKGVNISKSLSWERTAQDFVWQINNSPNLAFLAQCRHLIVLFGLEGAIYHRNDGVAESRLYFLPYEFEGGSVADSQGKMSGFTSCFVAGIARSIVLGHESNEEIVTSIGEGIREGIVATQKYFIAGFGKKIEEDPFPHPEIFIEGENDFIYKEHVQDVAIRLSDNTTCQSCWYILKDKSSTNLAEIAYSIVKNGVQHALKFIPIAQFGNLQTVDRGEIESYRSIKNLMWEYISTTNAPRPLCIAVFGTPGSGKSFGVTEIAASIAPTLIKKLNFNLSQLRTPLDLINAFHKVRDFCLEGKLPLVFFDEFDSAFEEKLGWLKYFLAPMQDGVFREGDSLHSIGKAIFVFAGGTSSTLKEFCGEDIEDEQEYKQFLLGFKGAKGPDFLSRLRGYVNILGPNQTNQHSDQLFIVRRAMLLRALLERKVPHLINDRGEAQIDNGVLRALLKIPRYKHESRSMEAILEMSLLTNAKKWEQSYLPSKEQMKLHVDEEEFLRHLMHDTFFSEKIESLSIAIHEKYRELNEGNLNVDSDFLKKWEELDEDLKESARSQARRIPNALLTINYDVVSVKETPPILEFTEKELDMLAIYEHTSWCRYQKNIGWKKGDVKDKMQKTNPTLVNWRILPKEKKNMVYQMVTIWPEILANANFKIERLKFLCDCETKI